MAVLNKSEKRSGILKHNVTFGLQSLPSTSKGNISSKVSPSPSKDNTSSVLLTNTSKGNRSSIVSSPSAEAGTSLNPTTLTPPAPPKKGIKNQKGPSIESQISEHRSEIGFFYKDLIKKLEINNDLQKEGNDLQKESNMLQKENNLLQQSAVNISNKILLLKSHKYENIELQNQHQKESYNTEETDNSLDSE